MKKINGKEYRTKNTYPDSGQKKVCKVEDLETGKEFIFKSLEFKEINEIQRLYKETEIMQRIDSKYFAKIFDKSLDFENKKFLILEEYIEGKTLREKLVDYKSNEIKCISLFKELVVGMKILWDQNIIHRDLKPENIMIKPDGKPVILDLGIVKCLNESGLTLTGEKMPYTMRYCTPEQFKNETNSISQRTDYFILGIVLSEMYLGEHVFINSNGEVDILGNYKRTGNSKLDDLLKKLLAKEPFDRYRNEKMILSHIKKEWGELL